jgi:hypothetical protein
MTRSPREKEALESTSLLTDQSSARQTVLDLKVANLSKASVLSEIQVLVAPCHAAVAGDSKMSGNTMGGRAAHGKCFVS